MVYFLSLFGDTAVFYSHLLNSGTGCWGTHPFEEHPGRHSSGVSRCLIPLEISKLWYLLRTTLTMYLVGGQDKTCSKNVLNLIYICFDFTVDISYIWWVGSWSLQVHRLPFEFSGCDTKQLL